MPFSQGESSGPNIIPSHYNKLSSCGAAETPVVSSNSDNF